jgi:hypothetical protein
MYQLSLDDGETVAYTVETAEQVLKLMEELFKTNEYISFRFVPEDGEDDVY